MRLRDLAAWLSQSVPTYLNVTELDLLGVDPDERIQEAIPPSSVGDRLFKVLDQRDLTISVDGNMLVITSKDEADSDPMIRLYDVGDILSGFRSDNEIYHDADHLKHQIVMHIDPDSWYESGGMSGGTFYYTNSRTYLVISAPFSTQLKVNAMLNRLQFSEPRFQHRLVRQPKVHRNVDMRQNAPQKLIKHSAHSSSFLRSPYRDLPSFHGRNDLRSLRFSGYAGNGSD